MTYNYQCWICPKCHDDHRQGGPCTPMALPTREEARESADYCDWIGNSDGRKLVEAYAEGRLIDGSDMVVRTRMARAIATLMKDEDGIDFGLGDWLLAIAAGKEDDDERHG